MEETGATPPTTIYTNSEEEGYNGLKDDLAEYFDSKHYGYDVDINSVDVETADGKITMNVTYTNPNDITETYTEDVEFKLYQETDGVGNVINEKTLDDTYLYSTTNTVKTQYTIDKIELDLTGMGPMIIQTGANEGQYLEIEIPALNAINLGLDDLDVSTEESATAAIDIVGDAINQLSAVRAKIGAYANRIEHTITNLDTTEENMTASYSRIMDVDMAEETTEYTSLQVLVQAATSVLAQANERPQEVLQLLQ
jgi:flagellin